METIEGTQDEIAKGFRTLQRINTRFRKARVRLYNKEASLLLATAGAGKFVGDLEAGRREREFLSCTASAKTTNPRKIHAPSQSRRTLASGGKRGRVRPPVPSSNLQQFLVGNKQGRAPSAKQQSPGSRDLGEFVAVTKNTDFPLSPSQSHPPTSAAEIPFSRGHSKCMLNVRTQPRARKQRVGLSDGGERSSFGGKTLNTTATATFTCPGPQQDIPPCILDLFETHETAIRRTVFLNKESEEFFKSPGWIVQESRQQQLAGLCSTQKLSIPSRSPTRIITGQDLSPATSIDSSFQTRALPQKVPTSPIAETVDHRSDHQEGHSGANPAPKPADGAPKKPALAPDGATSSYFVSSTTNSEKLAKTSVLQSSTGRQSDRLPSRAPERVEGGWNQLLREIPDRFPMPNRAGRTGSSSQVRLMYIDDRGCPRLACRNHCMHAPDEGAPQPACGRRTRSDTQLEGLKRASDKTRSPPGNSGSQTHSPLDKTDKGGTDDVPQGRGRETQSATVGGAASEKRARGRVASLPHFPGHLCGEGIVASSASRIRKYGTDRRGTQQSPAGCLACALSRKHTCVAEGQLRPSQTASLTNSYPPSREDSCSAGKRVPREPRSDGPDPFVHAETSPSHLPPWGITDKHSRPIAAFSRQSYRHRANVESRRGKGNVESFAFYEQVLDQSFRRSTHADI